MLIAAIHGWYDARLDRKKIGDLRAQIAERDQEQATAETMLNRPENRAMREKSQYLNELIARKAFSWTQAIETLERLMPQKTHLVSIAPELNEDNQLAIKMVVAGDSSERAYRTRPTDGRLQALPGNAHRSADDDRAARFRRRSKSAFWRSTSRPVDQEKTRVMPDLRETRRKLKITIGVLVGVSAMAGGLLVSPLVGSAAAAAAGTESAARATDGEEPPGGAASRSR